ncbi:MAG: efflux RND transporter periplasmic adaptor subunit [Arenibacter sp.]|nr:efflux RND transporter periplasmic adaptor subunit [Arenibacter sp.]
MKISSKIIIYSIAILNLNGFVSCKNAAEIEKTAIEEHGNHEEEGHGEEAMLTQQQYDALNMKIDSVQHRSMSGYIEVNGQLEVPPQNEASVTTVMGANVMDIRVIEGDKVQKGQILAYITHPDIIQLQTEFLNASNQLTFQEKEFNRQKKLYDAGVGSGETFQRAEAALQNAKGKLQGLRSQLQLLNINPETILTGKLTQRIPVRSPIEGAVEKVYVKTGQFVQAQNSMFEIVNTDHVHADLMVFEKDVFKVKVDQKVRFKIKSLPETELSARIISVSKTFEEGPKAVHVHAEIENKPDNLIPGMYVRGKILVDETQTLVLPQESLGRVGDKIYAFRAEREGEGWSFKPVEVITGIEDDHWVAVNFLEEVKPNDLFAYNNAYYLMAQMKKGEGGHAH